MDKQIETRVSEGCLINPNLKILNKQIETWFSEGCLINPKM